MAKRGLILTVGLLGTAGLVIYLATRAKAAPPPPPPGKANLYGKVTDAVTGKSIPGVRVTLDGMETFTDTDGNYLFWGIETGSYYLEFSKEGYETAVY